jgi:hypothetical protein
VSLCKVYEVPNGDRSRSAGAMRCIRAAREDMAVDGRVVRVCDHHAAGFELWFEGGWLYAAKAAPAA